MGFFSRSSSAPSDFDSAFKDRRHVRDLIEEQAADAANPRVRTLGYLHVGSLDELNRIVSELDFPHEVSATRIRTGSNLGVLELSDGGKLELSVSFAKGPGWFVLNYLGAAAATAKLTPELQAGLKELAAAGSFHPES